MPCHPTTVRTSRLLLPPSNRTPEACVRELPVLVRHVRRLVSGLALALLFTGCATNPATGQSQFTLFTEAEEIELGLQADREMVQTFGEYSEAPELSRYVSELGLAMAAQSERPDLPWTFRVLDDEVVNAFALPGGQVYITRGLLAHLNEESQLAGVLGHEIGHVTARHGIHGMSRDLALSLALEAGLVLLEAEEASDVASLGLGLLFLKFSRDQERQADALALRYTSRVGVDPYGTVEALRILSHVGGAEGGAGFLTWISTHPDPERRWQRLAEEAGLRPDTDSASRAADRARYLPRLEGLVVGADPRNGVIDGTSYTHVRDGFRIAFPRGWTVERERQTVSAASPQEDAVLLLLRGAEEGVEEAEAALTADGELTIQWAGWELLGGVRSRRLDFTSDLDGTAVRGVVALVPMQRSVLKLVALGEVDAWRQREADLVGAIRSFRGLAPEETRAARPSRLRVVRLQRPTSLRQLAPAGATAAELEALALLNDVARDSIDAPLAPGDWVKLVAAP